jgi:CRP/FNR family transcriptional regulator, cyclic AMP receptor protein
MIQQSPQADMFKQQLRDSLERDSLDSRVIKIIKHSNVYVCGDNDKTIYFIESGQVKILMLSPEGKECILAIYTAGDIFGESCLSGSGSRMDTAVAMEDTALREISSSKFFIHLSSNSLLEGFVQYLAGRIVDQQQVIANMVTVDSEQRLGKTLLQLARKLGKKDPRSIRIEQKISHEELSEMVGTTRPRISMFMQRFRELGLIEKSVEHYLIVREDKLTNYLAQLC